MNHNLIYHSADCGWGTKYYIMEELGAGFVLAYVYNDDPKAVVIGDLSVSPNHRNKGLGFALLQCAENISYFDRALLWVDSGTWQQDWYERMGYSYHSKQEKEGNNAVWLEKNLVHESSII